MSIALWCVFAAGFLPYVATVIAKGGRRDYDNREPRVWLARQEGFRQRANAAQLNSFEALPFFAAAVIVAHMLRGAEPFVDALAVTFIAARAAYVACYIANQPVLRSAAWAIGFLAAAAIFVYAAL